MGKKKKKKKKRDESSIEITIRLAKMRGGRDSIIIEDKKKYNRQKHKKVLDDDWIKIYITGVEITEGVEMAGKKGGIGGAIKGFFFESSDGDDEEDDVLETPQSSVSVSPTQSTASVASADSTPIPELKINKDIVDSIKQALEENKLNSYNYYDFMGAVEQQTETASEQKKFHWKYFLHYHFHEQKKFQIVYSVVKGMGVTKDQLVSTADHYLKIVEKHKAEFDSKVASEEDAKVTRVRAEAEKIETSITTKTDQIEKLKQEIDTLHKKKIEVLNIAQVNDVEIMQIKQDGAVAYKLFYEQIKDGKNKIVQYIS